MRELDVLLTRYLDRRYEQASEQQKAAFAALLGLSDPELIGYLLGREVSANSEIASVVKHIRSQAGP